MPKVFISLLLPEKSKEANSEIHHGRDVLEEKENVQIKILGRIQEKSHLVKEHQPRG